MKATILAQNTEGKEVKVGIETEFPKLKTATKKGVYAMEDLMKYAETGTATEEMKVNSPALVTMKQKEAVAIITDALAKDSVYVTEVVEKKEPKAAKEDKA